MICAYNFLQLLKTFRALKPKLTDSTIKSVIFCSNSQLPSFQDALLKKNIAQVVVPKTWKKTVPGGEERAAPSGPTFVCNGEPLLWMRGGSTKDDPSMLDEHDFPFGKLKLESSVALNLRLNVFSAPGLIDSQKFQVLVDVDGQLQKEPANPYEKGPFVAEHVVSLLLTCNE